MRLILRRSPILVLLAACAATMTQVGATQPEVDSSAEISPDASSVLASPRQSTIVPITGEITDVTSESLKRRVELAKEDGAQVIIFEIETPGGAVMAALDICDFIKGLGDIHTVAWVHSHAISAGSMIAMACDEIVMSAASSIGDCGVIMGSPLGAEAVPDDLKAKAESPVLAQFRDSANRSGYSRILCESLVVQDRVVWWLENTETGERVFVSDKIKNARIGAGDDPTTQPSINPTWKLVESYIDALGGHEVAVDQPVVDDGELLTMSQSEAVAYGFAKGIVSDDQALVSRYNLAGTPSRLEFTWSEQFVGYMTSMPVRTFLMIIILLGAYVEFHTPGVGVPGLVAVIALAVFVGTPYLTGLADMWDIVFILLGIVLLILELFVIPGFGLAGIAGVLMILMGMFWTFVPNEPGPWHVVPTMQGTWNAIRQGLVSMVTAMVVSMVAMVYLAKWLPASRFGSKLVLSAELAREETIKTGLSTIKTIDVEVGARGETLSILRPAGKARIDGQRRDVVTQGEMIEQGKAIEVLVVRGNRVVVRELGGSNSTNV